MNYSIFDIETDGLIDTVTKIHCLCARRYRDGNVSTIALTSYDDMRKFFQEEECLVGHKIITFDIPVVEKILGIVVTSRKIDTLGLSWYLYPNRYEHGLESWGTEFGIEKPVIIDWSNQTVEDYIYRCSKDVDINEVLFQMQGEYLYQIYAGVMDRINKIVDYLSFKLECAREQEEVKWKLDVAKCEENLEILEQESIKKSEILASVMPKKINYKIVSRPKNCFKKDGSVSAHGTKWFELLESQNLPEHHLGAVQVVAGEETGNPGSHQQIKAWLFSIGWIPATYKLTKSKTTGEVKKVPQLSNEDGTDLCDSVKLLYEIEPQLEHLEGLFVLNHRKGLLRGFLRDRDKDDYLMAQVQGFTNTLRFQHTTIVNLPTIPKPYWELVRGCLIAPEGYELCGSDMSGLEDSTKQHYMYFYDPDYVNQMRTPGFDPHIDISVRAKAMSYDEGEFYKWYDKKKAGKEYSYVEVDMLTTDNSVTQLDFKQLTTLPEDQQSKIAGTVLKPIRLKMKKGNFASVYGAGAPKLALTLGVPVHEAKIFHTAYWLRNKAVKEVARDTIHRTIGEQMWLYNPVSGFWYSLREEKDKFSTLNQGTGVYCFDTWVKYVRMHGVKITGQFHDEIIIKNPIGYREPLTNILKDAINRTNEQLKLNVPLAISIDFGHSYADIH